MDASADRNLDGRTGHFVDFVMLRGSNVKLDSFLILCAFYLLNRNYIGSVIQLRLSADSCTGLKPCSCAQFAPGCKNKNTPGVQICYRGVFLAM